MNENSNAQKRRLSVFQLFESLQEEYVIADLRSKIYSIKKHKEYWANTASGKKEKIQEIAKRNSIFSIFDNQSMMVSFRDRIYGGVGLPKFYYRDEEHRLNQEKWDIVNYFAIGHSFKVYDASNVEIDIVDIVSIDLEQSEALTISPLKKKHEKYPFSSLKRIM